MAKQKHALLEKVRGVLLLIVMMLGGLLISLVDCALYPVAWLWDNNYSLIHKFTSYGVKMMLSPFVEKVQVIGWENLDQTKIPRAVMVANHQSALDAFIFGDLWTVNFRVTFKWELLFYPGVGSTMWLAGYVPVKRGDKGSATRMMEQCASLLQRNVWILFFPEGTRVDGSSGPMGSFKAGAFKLALEQKVPIIPITISGSRGLMPARGYPSLGFGSPRLIAHPPVSTEGKTVEELIAECTAIIASALGPEDMPEAAGPISAASGKGSAGGKAEAGSREGKPTAADHGAEEKSGLGLGGGAPTPVRLTKRPASAEAIKKAE